MTQTHVASVPPVLVPVMALGVFYHVCFFSIHSPKLKPKLYSMSRLAVFVYRRCGVVHAVDKGDV